MPSVASAGDPDVGSEVGEPGRQYAPWDEAEVTSPPSTRRLRVTNYRSIHGDV